MPAPLPLTGPAPSPTPSPGGFRLPKPWQRPWLGRWTCQAACRAPSAGRWGDRPPPPPCGGVLWFGSGEGHGRLHPDHVPVFRTQPRPPAPGSGPRGGVAGRNGPRGAREAAHLLDGAAARVRDGEGHLARRDPGLALLHALPAGDDQVAGREAQVLQVAQAHVGLHPVRQAQQLWGRGQRLSARPKPAGGSPLVPPRGGQRPSPLGHSHSTPSCPVCTDGEMEAGPGCCGPVSRASTRGLKGLGFESSQGQVPRWQA